MTNMFLACHYEKTKLYLYGNLKREDTETDLVKINEENYRIRKLLNIANVYPNIKRAVDTGSENLEKRFKTDTADD